MRGYPTFAEALEHALEAAHDDAPRGDRFVYLPASAAPFVFVYSRGAIAERTPSALNDPRRERGPYASAGAPVQEVREVHTATPPPAVDAQPASPRRRVLSPEQQRALLEMAALGGPLRPDFTAPELRRTFRRLAREFHPDRHPALDAVGQARLSQIFADLAEHYRLLMTLFE
jgi:hypothetical protein